MSADAMAPYRLEQAKSDRSACTVSKEKIAKGEVRFGSLIKMGSKGSYKWRKLECITAKQVANINESIGGVEKIDGFEDLTPDEQAVVLDAFKVAETAAPVRAKAAAKALAAAGAADASTSDDIPAAPPAKKPRVSAKAKAKAAAAKAEAAVAEELEKAAHSAIDLAKNAQWKALFEVLDVRPALINVRPAVRDFAVLHQAAFHGAGEVVSVLLEEYHADPLLKTKHGKTAAEIAKDEGHDDVVEALEVAKPSASTPAAGIAAPLNLTPEKLTKEHRAPGAGITPVPEMTAAVLAAAHELIDHSKAGRWSAVFDALEKNTELVNARPEVREFSAFHQAAYLGDREAIEALVHRFGADPLQRTRSGLLPEQVARDAGHTKAADLIACLAKKVPDDSSSAAPAAAPAEGLAVDPEEDFKMVQMPNGSWKIVYAGAGGDVAPVESSGGSSASDAPPPSVAPAPTPVLTPEAVPVAMDVDEEAAAPPRRAPSAVSEAASVPAVDLHFPEAGWVVAVAPGGDFLECRLRQGSARAAVQQLLEKEGRFCVFSRWGPPSAKGQVEAIYFDSFEEASASFKAKFLEKTNNHWRDRHCFKVFFGRWTLVAEASPAEAPLKAAAPLPTPAPVPAAVASDAPAVPASTPARKRAGSAAPHSATRTFTEAEAHALIDLAKAGKWANVFKTLDKNGGLVDARPAVREYNVLHQAAYYGKTDAAMKLLDKYGAGINQLTKSGSTAADVAKEHGHDALAAKLAARMASV